MKRRPKARFIPPGSVPLSDSTASFIFKGEWKRCKRRVPRVDARCGQLPIFLSYPEISAQRFGVSTIAELGCRFTTDRLNVTSLLGRILDTTLHVGHGSFTLRSKMVSIDPGGASVQFLAPDEIVREMIRELFGPEFVATTLSPFHSYSSVVAGPTHTTIYSDGAGNQLELQMNNRRLEGVTAELEILDTRLAWSRRSAPQVVRISDNRVQGPAVRNRLISFLRNLQDLDPQIRSEVERIIRI
jgi:hypothetical protein